jgi:competence protein ComEC
VIRWVAAEVASWPGAAPLLPRPPVWGLVMIVLGAMWLAIWRTRLRWLGAPVMAAGLLSPLVARPPDILVSPDARLIAWHDGQQAWLARRPGAPGFQAEQFRRLWGERSFAPLPERDCGPGGCRLAGGRVLFLPEARRDPPCDVALMLSPEPIRVRCPGVPWVDRFSVWRDGAHAVWLGTDGVRILSDRAHRGDRPWVPPVPVPRARPQPGTTLAPAVVPPAPQDEPE